MEQTNVLRGLYAIDVAKSRFVWVPFGAIQLVEYQEDQLTKIHTVQGIFTVEKNITIVVKFLTDEPIDCHAVIKN